MPADEIKGPPSTQQPAPVQAPQTQDSNGSGAVGAPSGPAPTSTVTVVVSDPVVDPTSNTPYTGPGVGGIPGGGVTFSQPQNAEFGPMGAPRCQGNCHTEVDANPWTPEDTRQAGRQMFGMTPAGAVVNGVQDARNSNLPGSLRLLGAATAILAVVPLIDDIEPVVAGGGRIAAEGATTAESTLGRAASQRIQNAADRTGQQITVVGSRAAGTAGPTSDWDYILSGNSAQRHSAASSLPRGLAGGENGSGIDLWQDFNPNAPNYSPLDPTRPHFIFGPSE
jgi:hypothetical protein